MALITVVTPVYNEELNIESVATQVRDVFKNLTLHTFEHLFIDNASTDRSHEILRALAASDSRIKVIFNNRNFGHIRSPYYAMLQAHGDAVVLICGDLQEPPSLIADFITEWEKGFKVVLGVKNASKETWIMFTLRRLYYEMLFKLSDVNLTKNNTGFGLYDREVMEVIKNIGDCYPYLRGLVSELGYPTSKLYFTQAARKRGISKNNFYTLYDIAMLGITSHTKVPLRVATIFGFFASFVSLVLGAGFVIAKLLFWDYFPLGVAPILVGMFGFFSVQLFFLGLLGEYILAMHQQILKRPTVVERERLNFEK
jgi:glycosyltransferase involved in cell wall biosynthesis